MGHKYGNNSGGSITYSIDFELNKQQLQQLRSELKSIQNMSVSEFASLGSNRGQDLGKLTTQLNTIKKNASELETIFNKSFNTHLGEINLAKLNKELQNSKTPLKEMLSSLNATGAQGTQAFSKMATSISQTNLHLRQSHSILDSIATTLGNTIKWGIASSAVNQMTNSIQSAWNYTKVLDSTLNDIRIVSDKSAEDMERFAKQANKASQALGNTTKEYAEASLIYYQQGLGDEESQRRAEITTKVANVTGVSAQEASEQLTAIWNGYKVSAEEAEIYIDKVAKVAATTAADLEEMATGMSKVASAANNAGVDIDQLNAMLATIISVTREAPESVGTSLKTIFARLGDLKLGKTDEDGVSLGKVSGQLQALGVQVLDESGNMREMGNIIEDVAKKWETWTQAQKQAVAVAMAGKLQYSRFIALFDNWDMYTQAINDSRTATGELQKQQDIYMESTSAHLKQLEAAWERIADGLIDNKGVNSFIDVITGATGAFGNFVEAIGGGGNLLLGLGSIATKVFGQQIANSIKITSENLQANKRNLEEVNQKIIALQALRDNSDKSHTGIDVRIEQLEKLKSLVSSLSADEIGGINDTISKYGELQDKVDIIIDKKAQAKQFLDAIAKDQTDPYKEGYLNKGSFKGSANLEAIISGNKAETLQSQKDLKDFEKMMAGRTASVKKMREQTADILSKARDDWAKYETVPAASVKELDQMFKTLQSKVGAKDIPDIADLLINDDGEIDTKLRGFLNNFLQKYREMLEAMGSEYANIDEILANGGFTEWMEKTKKDADDVKDALNNIWDDKAQEAMIQGIVSFTGGITSLISAVNTFKNIGNIWENQDLSTGEKVLQITMAISTGIGQLAFSYNQLKTGIPSVILGLQKLAFAQLSDAEATAVVSAANMGFSATLKGVATAAAEALIPLLPYIAAIAAIAGVVYLAVKAYNEEADAAARASEQAQNATKVYEDCANAAKELHSNLVDYFDAIDNFKKLKIGAEGYAEALQTANEKAEELIKTLNLYDKYHYEDGLIIIDPDALAEAQFYANRAANVAEKGMYTAKIESNNANLDYQTKLLQRSVGTIYTTDKNGGRIEGTDYDYVEGAQLSKDSISTIVSELSKLDKTTYNQTMTNSNTFKTWLDNLNKSNLTIKSNTEQIAKQVNSFQQLVESTEAATKANKNYIDQINLVDLRNTYAEELRNGARDKNGEVNEGIFYQRASILNNAKSQDTIKQQKADRRNYYENLEFNKRGESYTDSKAWSREFSTDNKNTDVTDFLHDIGMSDQQIKDAIGYSNIKENEELGRAYAKLSNIDLSNTTFSKDKFVDNQGNTVLDLSSADKRGRIRRDTAINVANAYDDSYFDKLGESQTRSSITMLDELQNSGREAGEKYGTDWSNAVLNYLSSQGKNFDISSTFARLDPEEVKSMRDMTTEEIQNMLGLSEMALNEFGAGTAEEAAEKFQNALANYKWDKDASIEASLSKMNDELPDDLTKKKLEKYQEDVKVYASNLMEVAKNSEDVSDQMKYNSDAAVAFALRIIKLNKAIDTLANNYEDWSKILKESKDYSQEYAEAMYGMRDAIADVYDVSMDYVSNDFITKHLDEIRQIANGSEEAIESLRHAVGEEIVVNILLQNEVPAEELEGFKNDFLSIREQIETAMSGIKVGEDLDTSGFIDKLNTLIQQTGMSMEQVNSLMASLKLEPEFTTQEMTVPKKEKITQTIHTVDDQWTTKLADGTEVTNWTATDKVIDLGEKTSEDTVTVYGISGDGTPPQIKSVKKAPDSSYNNYSSVNKGGKSPGSSKKSGGSSKPSKEKHVEKETDPYHDVNIQLALTEAKLKKVQSQNDKAFGAKKIENYNNQLQLLNNKLDLTKEKLAIAGKEQQRLGDLLAARGAKFNPDGTLANYEELYKAQLAKVNAEIDKYNGMSKEQQEAYKDTLDAAKEDFSKFEEQLKDYDNTVSSLIPGLKQDLQDIIDEEIEINIKKFNMEFEIHLDMKDAQQDWNEFKKKILDDIKDNDIFGNAAARARDDLSVYVNDQNNGMLNASTKQTQEVLNELRKMDTTGWSDVYGDNRTKALEDLKTAYQEIEQDLLDIQQIQKDVHQAWLDTMDEINDKMSDQVAMYEQINNLIEHDQKIIKLVYGETDFDALGKYYEKQHNNYLGLLDFQRQNAEFWEKEMNSIADKTSDEWKSAKEKWIAAINDMNATVEAMIENARTKLENAIDGVFDKFNKQITNGKGLDYVQQQWDLINDVADDYLDKVNAAFGIRQIERKWQDAIDGTDNVNAQRKLNELMEKQLSQLKEKEKLTEYDVERAEKEYEIALKQLELEEAKNVKNTMRLRRDSQGNYRYEYVADEENIRKLQDELDVLQNSLYNFDKERWLSTQNEIVKYVQERQDAIKEIMLDASLTEEERQARILEINELYNEKIQDLTDQTVTAQENLYNSGAIELNKIWEQEGKDFNTLNQEQQRIMVEEMLPQFQSGVNNMIESFAGEDGFKGKTIAAMQELSDTTNDYNRDLEEIEKTAGQTFDEIENGLDKNIPKTEQLVDDNDELNDKYKDQLETIKELNNELDKKLKKYENISAAAKKAAEEAYNYWLKEQQIAAEKAAAENAKTTSGQGSGTQNPNTNINNNNNDNNGSSNNVLSNANKAEGAAAAIWMLNDQGGWYNGATRFARLNEKFGDYHIVQDIINSKGPSGSLYNAWKNRKNELANYRYGSFDTGGYTGDWAGDYGRVALLHSKELVLNKQDTENMLDMMRIARDVVASAGPRAIRINAGNMAAASGQLEQNVHIEANFPNVESANEIQEALENIVNLAAQRANRNNR